MFSFRVLNKDDLMNIKNDIEIMAKNKIRKDELLRRALILVPSHLQAGSKNKYPWISISNDFTTVVNRYCIPYLSGSDEDFSNIRRDYIAVFKDYEKTYINNSLNQNLLNLNLDLSRIPIKEFGKVVLDLSSDDKRLECQKAGLLFNVKGEMYDPNISRKPKAAPGYKYARNSKELLALNEIPFDNVFSILDPLEIDLVYGMYSENSFLNLEEVVNKNLSLINYDNIRERLNGEEKVFFEEFYVEKKFMIQILEEILKSNNINGINIDIALPNGYEKSYLGTKVYTGKNVVDVLALYNYLKNIKRKMLRKIYGFINYNMLFSFVKVYEDYLDIFRMGQYANFSYKLEYEGIEINLEKFDDFETQDYNNNSLRCLTKTYVYYDAINFDRRIFYLENDKLKTGTIQSGKEDRVVNNILIYKK